MIFEKVYVIYVYLSREEWGNEKMEEVAKETHEDHKDKAGDVPLIIMVHEHAGWFLGYTMLEGRLQTVYSANDVAKYYGAKKDFREAVYKAKWEHLVPGIRREPR